MMTAPCPPRHLLPFATLLFLLFPYPSHAAVPTRPASASSAQDTAPGADAPCVFSQTIVNGTGELTLCTQGRKVWKERRDNARTAQIYATITNTGPSVVCDLHVEVEHMKDALRWWPTWLNTTKYPYFSLSPGQAVCVGVVVPQPKGFPLIQVTQMRPCDGESPPLDDEETAVMNETGGTGVPVVAEAEEVPVAVPIAAPAAKAAAASAAGEDDAAPAKPKKTKAKGGAATAAPAAVGEDDEEPQEVETPPDDDEIPSALTGKKKCEIKTGENGLKVRWCVELKPYVWVEPRHKKRYVRVQGEVTNLEKDTSLCHMKFWVESNNTVRSTWPEWWPNSGLDAPLDPGNSFVVGANVRFKKGTPKIGLLSDFEHCTDPGAEDVPVATPAPAPVPAPGEQVTEGWQGQGGQQQQQQQQQQWWTPAPAPSPAPAPWQPDGQQQQWKNGNQGNQGNHQWTPAPAPAPWSPPANEQYNANNNNNWHV